MTLSERPELSPDELRRVLPSRVKDAITAIDKNPAKAGRVVDSLLTDLTSQSTADLTFDALRLAQKEALAGRTPKIKKAGITLSNTLTQIFSREDEIYIVLTPHAQQGLSSLVRDFKQIESQRFLAMDIGSHYTRFMNFLTDQIPNATIRENLILHYKAPRSDEKTDMTIKEWQTEIDATKIDNPFGDNIVKIFDKTVSLLKTQPESAILPNIWTFPVDGVSLADIEHMKLPLNPESQETITRFFLNVMRGNGSPEHIHLRYFFTGCIQSPLAEQFGIRDERVELVNMDMIRVIKDWRQRFYFNFLYGDEKSQKATADLLRASVKRGIASQHDYGFLITILEANAFIGLKEETATLFYAKAWQEKAPKDPIDRYFIYPEDVLTDAYTNKYLDDYYTQIVRVTGLPKSMLEKTFSSAKRGSAKLEIGKTTRGKVMDKFLEHFVSGSFFAEANEKANDFSKQAQTVWKDIKADTAHTLPLQDGVDIIQMREDSLPYLMGIEKVSINRIGDTDWGVRIRFDFRKELPDFNDRARVTATISPDGTFVLNANLPEKSQHFSSLFHLIATLALRDLTAQEEKKRIFAESKSKPAIHTGNGHSLTELPRVRIYRQQRQEELEDDVRPHIPVELNPHKVGLHASRLPGIPAYEQAMVLRRAARDAMLFAALNHPITDSEGSYVDQAFPTWSEIFSQIDNNVDKTFDEIKGAKPSVIKLQTWPEGVPQKMYKDRRSDKVVYATTWTAEHTWPKLTEYQEVEVALWQRQYRNITNTQTSALASLDEYKPLLAA